MGPEVLGSHLDWTAGPRLPLLSTDLSRRLSRTALEYRVPAPTQTADGVFSPRPDLARRLQCMTFWRQCGLTVQPRRFLGAAIWKEGVDKARIRPHSSWLPKASWGPIHPPLADLRLRSRQKWLPYQKSQQRI